MSDDYSNLNGYNPDADLGLGCGLPTQFAGIQRGDVVVDLAPALETIALWRVPKPANREK